MIAAPGLNFVPVIVREDEPVEYAEEGETRVIVGRGLLTVKNFSLVEDEPSLFLTVRLYSPNGRPVRGREHFMLVFPVIVPETVLFMVPFVIVTVAFALKLVPLMVTETGARFSPEFGVISVIDGTEPEGSIVNNLVAFEPPGLITVRLYDPGERPFSTKIPTIFVWVKEVIDPGTEKVSFIRKSSAPEMNLVPVIVSVEEPVGYPEDGEIKDIAGLGLFTMNAFCRVSDVPSAFCTVTLYNPKGSPIRGREHLIIVVPVLGPESVLFVVPFVMVTVVSVLKLVPVIVIGWEAIFTPEVG